MVKYFRMSNSSFWGMMLHIFMHDDDTKEYFWVDTSSSLSSIYWNICGGMVILLYWWVGLEAHMFRNFSHLLLHVEFNFTYVHVLCGFSTWRNILTTFHAILGGVVHSTRLFIWIVVHHWWSCHPLEDDRLHTHLCHFWWDVFGRAPYLWEQLSFEKVPIVVPSQRH